MTNVLALDYGTQRIGVAVSRGSLAEPLIVLENDQDIFHQLDLLREQHQINMIVVGISEGAMADQTREFVQEMEEVIRDIPIEFMDETLSSHEVAERLRQQGIKKSVRTGHIDHFAAALILEEWLAQQ